MGQPGFLDLQQRYEGLDAKSDPLVAILAAAPFELFRVKLKTALVKGGLRRADADRKSAAGRKPWDEVLIFKALVLQALYNLSDDAMEYQLRDRLSFMRFVGLGLEDAVPDAKTLWLYREALAKAGAVEGLFNQFDGYLKAKGYLAMGGQIIDATIVPVPRQRNSRDDNATVKAGETPREWEAQPAKDRQKLEDVLDPSNTASSVWADSAYRSKEAEEMLRARAMTSHIHRRGSRGKPLTPRQEAANKTRSKVRARVEHVFGNQHVAMGGKFVRTFGIVRATVKIGMQNLAYNMRRLVVLERAATVVT